MGKLKLVTRDKKTEEKTATGNRLKLVVKKETEAKLRSGLAQEQDNSYKNWADSTNALGTRLADEYRQREGKYQSVTDFAQYRDRTNGEIDELMKKANESYIYYSKYGDLYGEGEKERITGDIDKAIQYLNDLRSGLAQEENYWKQFKDEADYTKQLAAWEQEKKDEEYYSAYDVAAGKAQLDKVKNDLLSISAEYNEAAGFGGTDKVLGMDDIPSEEEIREQQSGIRARHEALTAEQEKLEREIKEAEYRQTRNRYGALAQNTDFDALSKRDLSVDDALYRHLNGEEVTLHELRGENKRPGDYEELGFMDEKELGVYNYLYRKEGKAAADEYLDWIGQDLSQRRYDKAMQDAYGYGKDSNGFTSTLKSLLSVPENLAGGIVSFGERVVKDMTGQEFDPYSRAQQMGATAEQTRAGISSNFGDVGKFLYNTVMSGADSLAAGKLLPGSFLPGMVLAAGAASSNARDIAQRGGTREQQLAGGLAAGLFEMLFEASSIGNLKSMKEVPVSGLKDFLLNIVKSAGVNASEEALTELANIIYDTAAMGDISNWNIAMAAYEAQDMAPEDAKMQVIKDMAWQVAQAAGSGALMGIGFGGIGTAQSLWSNPGTVGMGKQGRQIQKQGGYNALLDEALKLDFDTPAYQMALQMRDGTMEANDLNIGRLAAAVEQQSAKNAASNPETADDVLRQAAEEVTRQENAPQTMADSLPVSVSEVQTGTDIAKPNVAQRGAEGVSAVSDQQAAKNMAQVREYATIFGVHGSKALSAAYDETTAKLVSAQDAQAGFFAAYTAARDGKALSAEEQRSVAKLTPGLRFAAETAGEADALRAKQAVYFGKDAELVKDDMLKKANLRSKDRRMLDAIAKNAGIKVRMVDKLVDERGYAADAQYKDGELLISLEAGDPVRAAFTHDLVHRIRVVSPEAYTTLASFVRDNMSRDNWNALVKGEASRYGEKGMDYLSEEMVADAFGKLMGDSALLDQFVKEDRNAWQIVLDAIKDMIASIKRVLNGQNVTLTAEQKADFAELQANLEGVSKALEKALKQMEADVKHNTKEGNKNTASEGGEVKYAFKGYDPETGRGIYQSNFPLGTPKQEKASRILGFIQNVWSKKPIELVVEENGEKRVIHAQFDPDYDESGNRPTDASKLMGGNRHGNASDKRVTLNLADDYYQIASEAVYNGFKNETGKDAPTHKDVTVWRYFINDILYQEYDNDEFVPYRVTVNVKERTDGQFVYSFNAERDNGQFVHEVNKQKERPSTRQTLHAAVNQFGETEEANAQPNNIISMEGTKSNPQNSEPKNSLTLASNPSTTELIQENTRLKEQVEKWKGQTKRTTTPTLRQGDVDKLTRQIVKDYDGTLDWHDIAGDVKALGEFILRGGEELTWSEVKERAMDIGRRIVNSAQVLVDGELEQDLNGLKGYLRNVKLAYEDNGDIPDFNDWRKRYFGKLTISKDGLPVDAAYQELQGAFGEVYFPADITHPSDQLMHIAQLLDDMQSVMENPFSADMEQAIQHAANALIDGLLSEQVRQTPPTFADKQAAKLDKAKAKSRESTKRQLDRVRADRDAKLEQLKEKHRAKDKAGRERQSAGELRRKIGKHVSKLSQKLLKPSDKQHVPESLRGAVAAMLEAINLEGPYTIDPDTGKRVKNGGGELTKRTAAFEALRKAYQQALTEGGLVIDPDLLGEDGNLAKVIEMRHVRLSDMSTEQLETVWRTIRAVEKSITDANKLLAGEKFAGVLELAQDIKASAATRKAKGNYGGLVGWADSMTNTEMLDPLTFLHSFGKGGDALYRILQNARDQRTTILKQVTELTGAATEGLDVKELQRQKHTFTTENGDAITVTTAQLMSLYELNKRQQAQDHIYKGGIRPEVQKNGVSKDKTAKENLNAVLGKLDAPAESVHVTQEDVRKMLSALTEDQIKAADELQLIMENYLADEGNKASMAVYGYKKFMEKNYFPISSDPHQVQSKIGDVIDGQKRPRSIAEWGSAKGTVERANNGLVLGDIFDVFAQHAVDMATYASHLAAVEDMNRVRNFQFRDAEGNRTGAMGDIIDRVMGRNGNAYLDKLLQDVSAGTAKGGGVSFAKLTANYKAASVGLNMRVALQQPTSYLRAAAVIDPKYLMQAIGKTGGWEKALKYAPIAQWKEWGNFEINQGRQLQDIMFGTDSKLDKARENSMWLAGKMDSITWGAIWNACELEMEQTQPELRKGSEGFYQTVAERFTDVIDQTQVVDNVLGRSQIMRNTDTMQKMATSYLGEPTKQYNMLYRAFTDWNREQDNAKRSAALKKVGVTATSWVAANFMNAVAQSLWDAVRDDDEREEKYWERFMSHVLPNFFGNINPLGGIPYVKDVVSTLQGYEVKRMDMQAIAGLISALQGVEKALRGEGRYTVVGSMANLLAEFGRIVGLPVATVKRDLTAIARNFAVEIGDWQFQYYIERTFNSLGSTYNRGEFYDILFGALQDGDLDAYNKISQDMVNRGVKSTAIENAMRSRYKDAVTADSSFAMSEDARDLIGSRDVYSTAEEQADDGFSAADLSGTAHQKYTTQRAQSYREMADELEGNRAFKGLPDKDKNKALEYAWDLADKTALEDASGGRYEVTTKWMTLADDMERAGVDPADYVLFHLAYEMAESTKDADGNTVKGESKSDHVREWLEEYAGLTEAERKALWGTVYTSKW